MAPHEEKLLCVKEVARLLKISTRTVWRLSTAGKIPPPIRLSSHVVRWNKDQILRLCEQQQIAS